MDNVKIVMDSQEVLGTGSYPHPPPHPPHTYAFYVIMSSSCSIHCLHSAACRMISHTSVSLTLAFLDVKSGP